MPAGVAHQTETPRNSLTRYNRFPGVNLFDFEAIEGDHLPTGVADHAYS